MTDHLSITQAAKLNEVTRQAIYVAIRKGTLKAIKDSKWKISVHDFYDYINNKYSRTRSRVDGELLYDKSKGEYSIRETAKLLNVPDQKLYYAARKGYINKREKHGKCVLHIDDIKAYKQKIEIDERRKANRNKKVNTA